MAVAALAIRRSLPGPQSSFGRSGLGRETPLHDAEATHHAHGLRAARGVHRGQRRPDLPCGLGPASTQARPGAQRSTSCAARWRSSVRVPRRRRSSKPLPTWMRETLRVPPGVVGPGVSGTSSRRMHCLRTPTWRSRSMSRRCCRASCSRLVFVRRPSLFIVGAWSPAPARILGLGRLMDSYRLREELEAERLLAQVEAGSQR